MQRLLPVAIAITAACRLDPLVDDMPGVSANILPADAKIPSVADNPDLLTQVTLNDGLDSDALMANGNVILRGTGFSDGKMVRFWSFGGANRAPAPMYLLGTGAGTDFQALTDHLPLVDAVPGDSKYNPIHSIYQVTVTDRYHGEKLTTTGALADAIELGLVMEPVAIKFFVDSPIVRPGTTIELGPSATATAAPTQVYARGHLADTYQLGGALGVLPNPGLLPTSQVSFLRVAGGVAYDATRPIFQATIPTTPINYTPLSVVVDVDLTGSTVSSITHDSDLFTRSTTTGAITATTSNVAQFAVTASTQVLQLQFKDGSL